MSSSPNFASSSSMSPAGGGPCGACKFLRRKCAAGCIFAPYFDSEQGAAHFAAVHKVFGASNVSKLLLLVPVDKRPDAIVTLCYEAQARLRDPVHGCVAYIFALQQQIVNLQAELSYIQSHLATLRLTTPPPAPPQPPALLTLPPLSIADLPTISAIPATYDLSSLLDPIWTPHRHEIGTTSTHFPTATVRPSPEVASSSAAHRDGGDLQELAREFLAKRIPPVESCRKHASPDLPPNSS